MYMHLFHSKKIKTTLWISILLLMAAGIYAYTHSSQGGSGKV